MAHVKEDSVVQPKTPVLRNGNGGAKEAGASENSSAIRVIARAADILLSLSQHPDGLSLREIARRVQLPLTTVQRIVTALDEANLVIAASASRGVRLGPALIALALSVKQFNITEIAHPVILQVSHELVETVDLAVFAHEKAVVVDQVQGIQPLIAVSHVGSSLPLHASASGKALLAALSDEDLDKLRNRLRLARFTKNTLVTWDKLDREIETIRRQGVAYDREEYLTGICAVAMALRGPTGDIAAVSVPVPKARFIDKQKELTRALVERCQALQRRIQP